MRLSFVQSYPVYHDGHTLEEWLALRSRDRVLPALAARLGHEVELLAVGPQRFSCASTGPDLDGYRVEIFPADRGGARTRGHRSRALLEHARRRNAELHVIKGIDGGAGIALMRDYLLPQRKPFAVVIGGKYYNRWVARADLVLYETEEQRDLLQRPGMRFWRRSLGGESLVRLPKSVDTGLFRPAASAAEKCWDVILVGRLLRWKNFEAVAPLARAFRVAVIGGGPEERRLRALLPGVAWLGRQPHHEVAELLRRAWLLFHPGRRDYYPRVAAEAFACGLPVVAIEGGISPDAIPPGAGLVVKAGEAVARLRALLEDRPRLEAMSRAAREHAVANLDLDSGLDAIRQMIEQVARRG